MQRSILRVLVILALLAPACAWARTATPADSYLALKKQCQAGAPISYAALSANIAALGGRVVEVRGTVAGVAQSSTGATLILSLGGEHESVTVVSSHPGAPQASTGDTLRVLARVPENALCVTSLELVGCIMEYDIAPRDPKPAPKPVVVAAAPASPSSEAAAPAPAETAVVNSRAQRGDDLASRGAAVVDAYRMAVKYFNRRISDAQAEQIARHVLNYSYYNKIDARLVMAVIAVESNFNPQATSRKGAMGLGQLMPGTARGMGVSNAYNPEQNVAAAARIIRGNLKAFEGRPLWEQISLAMACYNAGPGAVKKYGGVPPYRETQSYVKKVAGLYKAFCGVH